LEVRSRVSFELADLAGQLEQLARRRLTRGRYDLVVRAEGAVCLGSMVNMDRAQALYEALCALRDRVAPSSDVPFSMLSVFPEVFASGSCCQDSRVVAAAGEALDRAIDMVEVMREQEGNALRIDLLARLSVVRSQVKLVADRRDVIVDGMVRRLRDRVHRMLDDGTVVDSIRLAQEVAMAAERCDVEEEITRLHSHFAQFELLSMGAEPSGRRLDFLLQEVVREINTLGAKSQDASVAHLVVDMKVEIERMREQVQNVE